MNLTMESHQHLLLCDTRFTAAFDCLSGGGGGLCPTQLDYYATGFPETYIIGHTTGNPAQTVDRAFVHAPPYVYVR